MEIKQVLKALSALSQENRLTIFRLLVQAGNDGRSVGEIAAALKMANATLSFHLKELTNAALIDSRQQGRFIYYSANYSQMKELLGFLTENCCGGASCAPVGGTGCKPPRSTKSRIKAAASQLTQRRASMRSR